MININLKLLEYQFKVARTFFVSDEKYRLRKYNKIFGRHLSLYPPQTLNEKINYRMLYQRREFFSLIADKIAVREYVKCTIGREYLVPLLGVYDRPEEINFSDLPDSFVMKCNHDSGSTLVCNDKSQINMKQLNQHFNYHMRKNPYYTNREWHYKNIIPKILIEEKIDIYEGKCADVTPEMYRIHCFHGIPHIIEVDFTDSSGNEYVNIYSPDWVLLPFTLGYAKTPYAIPEPSTLKHIIVLAGKIGIDFDYCRLDLMVAGEKIYFSEITLTPESGQLRFEPIEWDKKLGELWVI